MINTTFPYETSSPGVARHQCDECGAWERADKGAIHHGKRCESRLQVTVAAPAEVPAAARRESYAQHVRDLADNSPLAVQPRDWSLAMNRDD